MKWEALLSKHLLNLLGIVLDNPGIPSCPSALVTLRTLGFYSQNIFIRGFLLGKWELSTGSVGFKLCYHFGGFSSPWWIFEETRILFCPRIFIHSTPAVLVKCDCKGIAFLLYDMGGQILYLCLNPLCLAAWQWEGDGRWASHVQCGRAWRDFWWVFQLELVWVSSYEKKILRQSNWEHLQYAIWARILA